MADKKISEQLGAAIFEAGKEIVGKKLSKAQYDKSYKTTIVGCNRYFIDDVPAETQAELIKKYNIPEVSVSGVYYTFRINGNWYVKSSNNDFKLYEEVVVRVPNGNWDNMFIEVQRDTVVEGGGTGVLSAVKIDGNKLFYNGEEYRLQFGNNKRIMCVTKGKLHYIVETEDINSSYIEAATAVINGLTNDCDIEFDANIVYPDNTFNIRWLFESSTKLTGITIDWGDGTTTTYPETSHVYGVKGMFRIKLSGLSESITSFDMGNITNFWNGIVGDYYSIGSHAYIGGNITAVSGYSQYVTKLTWGESIKEVRAINGSGERVIGEFREMSVPPCVNVIGQYGYGGQSNYVYIPPECTSIERMSFFDVPLKDIEISPDGDALTIGDYAFNQIATIWENSYSCVTAVEIPSRAQLGNYSFHEMGTRIVRFERGTEEIPSYAINSINRKRSFGDVCPQNYNELYVFIPCSVKSIGDNIIYPSSRVIIVYEGSSSDWDKITKSFNWNGIGNGDNTNVKFIYDRENYDSYPFCVQEIKKFHEFKSADDGAYVAGRGISISDSTISVNAEDGLIFDHGTLKVNAGTGIQCGTRSKGKVSVIIGDGLEIVTKEGSALPEDVNGKVTLKKATNNSLGGVKIGKGITVAEDGTISAEGKEYIQGEGINITDNIISLNAASTETLGGVKVGKGLKISADGTLETNGGGNYTSGDGIEITKDDVINVKQATGTEIGGIILGEGLEYDAATGKTNTVPNIQQAVIITEADAKYLLHEYTQIEYIAGNKIGYAGAQNQIIAQGYIIYKNGGTAPNGVTIANTAVSDPSGLPDIPMYTDMPFSGSAYFNNTAKTVRAYMKLVSSDSVSDNYSVFFAFEDGTERVVANRIYNYDNFQYGLSFVWTGIYPPGYTVSGVTHPYGAVQAQAYYKAKTSRTGTAAYRFQPSATLMIDFATEAEYNAAVGLTYEPQTLVNVEETITEV